MAEGVFLIRWGDQINWLTVRRAESYFYRRSRKRFVKPKELIKRGFVFVVR